MTDKSKLKEAEDTDTCEIVVTLICPAAHEWPTTATQAGKSIPIPGHPNEYFRPLAFAAHACPICRQEGRLKSEHQNSA